MAFTGKKPQDTDAPADKPTGADKPTAKPEDKGAAAHLSAAATTPGDKQALAAVRTQAPPEKGAGADVPPLLVVVGKVLPAAHELDKTALATKAREIHEALTAGTILGLRLGLADRTKVLASLDSLSEKDAAALRSTYGEMFKDKDGKINPNKLSDDLKANLNPVDNVRAQAMLARKDSHTNDAGNLAVELTALKGLKDLKSALELTARMPAGDATSAAGAAFANAMQTAQCEQETRNSEKKVREIFTNLNSGQIALLDEDFQRNYGKTFKQALAEAPLSDMTRKALAITAEGVDKRSPDQSIELANLAVKNKDVDLFAEALRGDSDSARTARLAFQNDGANVRLSQAFDGADRQRVQDIVDGGRLNLATIVDQDNAHWWSENKGQISRALLDADDNERQSYRRGREFALTGKAAQTPEEQADKRFYERLHGSLQAASASPRELAAWEDKLVNKGSLISSLAELHSDGLLGTKLFSGHDRNALLSRVENMDAADFKRIHDQDFKRDLDIALSTFATDSERKQILEMVKEKEPAPDWEHSLRLGRRSVEQLINEKQGTLFGAANAQDTKTLLEGIRYASPDELKHLQDPAYAARIDNLLKQSYLPTSDGYRMAMRLIDQAKSGMEPEVKGSDRFLYALATGAGQDEIIGNISRAFQEDPSLKTRLAKPLNDRDRTAAADLDAALFKTDYIPSQGDYDPGSSIQAAQTMVDSHKAELFSRGDFSLETKMQFAPDKRAGLALLADASPEERQALLHPQTAQEVASRRMLSNRFDQAEMPLVNSVLEKGAMDIADQARATILHVGPELADLERTLKMLSPEQIEQVKNDYATRFGSSLDKDLGDFAPDSEKVAVARMLTPHEQDGRQSFQDQLSEQLRSRSGIADEMLKAGLGDGSRLYADRQMDQTASVLSKFSLQFEKLPKEKQEEITAAYAKALQDYRDSKGAMTGPVVDSVMLVGTLVVGATVEAGTFGTATPLVAAAVGGALIKVGATEAFMGGDNKKDARSQALLAIEGGTMVAGGLFGTAEAAALARVGEGAAARAAAALTASIGSRAATEGAVDLLKVGYQKIAQTELAALSRQALVAGKPMTQDQIMQVAKDLVREDLSAEAKQKLTAEVARLMGGEYDLATEAGARTWLQSLGEGGRRLAQQTAVNSIGAVGADIAGQTAALPLAWDASKSAADNLKDFEGRLGTSVLSGAGGALIFTAGFHVVRPLVGQAARYAGEFSALTNAARDTETVSLRMVSDGKTRMIIADAGNPDVLIRDGHGQNRVVAAGQEYRLAADDEIVGVAVAAKPPRVLRPEEQVTGAPQSGEHDGPSRPDAGSPAEPQNYAAGDRVLMRGDIWQVKGEYPDGRLLVYRDRSGEKLSPILTSVTADQLKQYHRFDADGKILYGDSSGNVYSSQIDTSGRINLRSEYSYQGVDGQRVQKIAKSAYGVGDEVTRSGENWRVLAYTDRGELVLGAARDSATAGGAAPREIRMGEALVKKDYRPLNIEGKPYVADANGFVYTTRSDGRGSLYLAREQRFQVAPSDSVRATLRQTNAIAETAPEIPPDITADVTSRRPDHVLVTAYTDAKIYINRQEVAAGSALSTSGHSLPIGRETAGIKASGRSDLVSTDHGSLAFDSEAQLFSYSDHSEHGSFIKRKGTDQWVELHGTKEKPASTFIGPGDEVRLGSPREGPRLDLRLPHGESADRLEGLPRTKDVRVELNGLPVKVENGSVTVGRDTHLIGNPTEDILNKRVELQHAKLTWNADRQTWVVQDLSVQPGNPRAGTGTYIQHQNNTFTDLRGNSAELLPGDIVHLGSPDGPRLKVQTDINGEELPDGRVKFTRDSETIYRRPDNSTEIVGSWGSRIEDSRGNIVQARDSAGAKYGYTYDANNKLKMITFDEGTRVGSDDGVNWVAVKPDGKASKFWKGSIDIGPDGSMQMRPEPANGKTYVRRLDHSLETIDAHDRVKYSELSFEREKQRLNTHFDKFSTQAERDRAADIMAKLEERVDKGSLSSEEVVQTYHQINRLLDSDESTILTRFEREKLAQQVLYQTASPLFIDQGFNSTCNVTTVEKRLFARQPSEAARLITDVALTGKYVSASGKVIDLQRVYGAIHPDEEARNAIQFPASSHDYSDLRVDGQRTWASQIFENTAVNLKWASSAKPGEVMLYEKGPRVGDDTGETLNRYTVDSQGTVHRELVERAPEITDHDLTGIHNDITGGNDSGFVLSRPLSGKASGSGDVVEITNSWKLRETLEDLKKNGNFPAIVMVHTSSPFFQAGPGAKPGWHVVNVQDIFEDKNHQIYVNITNQWGRRRILWGNSALTIDELYDSMKIRKP